LRKTWDRKDPVGRGKMNVRPALTGARCAALTASVAMLLATAAPAAAQYNSHPLFMRRYAPSSFDIMVQETRRGGKAARRSKLVKEAGKREAEKLPAGPLQIVISIKKQQLALYSGGHLAARSSVSTGVPGHPTPQGVFSVLQKQIYHESNIYSSAPMP